MKMTIDWREVGFHAKKWLILFSRISYRSVRRHPFVAGMLVFLVLLYRYSPAVFFFLLSNSPVIICTAVLLGTLLSLGQPHIPNVTEKEEVESRQEVSSLEVVGGIDHVVVEKDGNSELQTPLLYKERDTIKSFDEGVDNDLNSNFDKIEGKGVDRFPTSTEEEGKNGGTSIPAERQKDEEIIVGDLKSEFDVFFTPIRVKGMEELQVGTSYLGRELHGNEMVEDSTLDEAQEDIESNSKFYCRSNSGRTVCFVTNDMEKTREERNLVDHDSETKINVKAFEDDGKIPETNVPNTLPSSLVLPRVRVDHHGMFSDFSSDDTGSSSPDTSLVDLIPMLDKLYPLKATQPPSAEVYNSINAEISESYISVVDDQGDNPNDGDDENDSVKIEKEGEKIPAGKHEGQKCVSGVTWTEDDRNIVMDIGSSELERNQGLENLMARNHARRNQTIKEEEDLIDLQSEKDLIELQSEDKMSLLDCSDSTSNMVLEPVQIQSQPVAPSSQNPLDLLCSKAEEMVVSSVPSSSAMPPLIPSGKWEPFSLLHEHADVEEAFVDEMLNHGEFMTRLNTNETLNTGASTFEAIDHREIDTDTIPLYSTPDIESVSCTESLFHVNPLVDMSLAEPKKQQTIDASSPSLSLCFHDNVTEAVGANTQQLYISNLQLEEVSIASIQNGSVKSSTSHVVQSESLFSVDCQKDWEDNSVHSNPCIYASKSDSSSTGEQVCGEKVVDKEGETIILHAPTGSVNILVTGEEPFIEQGAEMNFLVEQISQTAPTVTSDHCHSGQAPLEVKEAEENEEIYSRKEYTSDASSSLIIVGDMELRPLGAPEFEEVYVIQVGKTAVRGHTTQAGQTEQDSHFLEESSIETDKLVRVSDLSTWAPKPEVELLVREDARNLVCETQQTPSCSEKYAGVAHNVELCQPLLSKDDEDFVHIHAHSYEFEEKSDSFVISMSDGSSTVDSQTILVSDGARVTEDESAVHPFSVENGGGSKVVGFHDTGNLHVDYMQLSSDDVSSVGHTGVCITASTTLEPLKLLESASSPGVEPKPSGSDDESPKLVSVPLSDATRECSTKREFMGTPIIQETRMSVSDSLDLHNEMSQSGVTRISQEYLGADHDNWVEGEVASMNELDEDLLQELDSIGDFGVAEEMLCVQKLQKQMESGEESEEAAGKSSLTQMIVLQAQSVEDIHLAFKQFKEGESSKSFKKQMESREESEEAAGTSSLTQMIVLEAQSVEDIHLAFKQFKEGESSKSFKKQMESGKESEETAETSPLTQMIVLEAQSVEDIDIAFKQFREGESSKSFKIQMESSKESEETAETSSLTQMIVLEAQSVEDIDIAFKQFREGESSKPFTHDLAEHENDSALYEGGSAWEHLEVRYDESEAEFVEARSHHDDMLNQFSQGDCEKHDSQADVKHFASLHEDHEMLEVLEARTLQDIDLALKQFNRQGPGENSLNKPILNQDEHVASNSERSNLEMIELQTAIVEVHVVEERKSDKVGKEPHNSFDVNRENTSTSDNNKVDDSSSKDMLANKVQKSKHKKSSSSSSNSSSSSSESD